MSSALSLLPISIRLPLYLMLLFFYRVIHNCIGMGVMGSFLSFHFPSLLADNLGGSDEQGWDNEWGHLFLFL
jgi:hypothetical protein